MIIYPEVKKTGEFYDHKQDNAQYPIIKVYIEGEEREYYFKRHCYPDCPKCKVLQVKLGWNPNNNCLSAFCKLCGHRYDKGLSQVKNGGRRDRKDYEYFKEYQEEKDRLFCEICFRPDKLNIHHIVEVYKGGGHEPENLQLLCFNCHNLVHNIRKIAEV